MAAMKVLLALALVGCGTDTGGMMMTTADAPAGANVINVSGHITANATWSDFVNVTGPLTIDPGVTVMVSPGTQIKVVDATTSITLQGTMDIEATKASPATLVPGTAGGHWAGFAIGTGGVLTAHYLIGNGGGVHLSTGGTATLIDTQMSRDTHDLLTMAGGTADVEYSWIGLEMGQADTTHCAMHLGGAINLKVTHSNISTSVYGTMFYGGTNIDFTYDNWFGNGIDVDTIPGSGVSGNFSNGWFAKGNPTGATGTQLTFNNMSATRLTDAGPR